MIRSQAIYAGYYGGVRWWRCVVDKWQCRAEFFWKTCLVYFDLRGIHMALPSVVQQFLQLTSDEKIYIFMYPEHATAIKASKETAYAETRRRFGRNGHNDRSDAFRHCFWSALLSREIGYAAALRFTTAHESSPSNDPSEKVMDLHNNSVGLKIGRAKGSDQALSHRCMAALNSGQLKVLAE